MTESLKLRKSASPQAAANFLYQIIKRHLDKDRPVLWFVSGGSAVAVAAEVARLLEAAHTSLDKLTVSLADERYGPPGHADSNWEHLRTAGFDLSGATLQPVLVGADAASTLQQFNKFIGEAFLKPAYKIGLLGIGADGHTAGILPNTAAVASRGLVSYYETPEFKRITLTPSTLSKLNEAVVFATGRPKWKTLDQLEEDLPLNYQPAQILKTIPKVTIFNDYKGDNDENRG